MELFPTTQILEIILIIKISLICVVKHINITLNLLCNYKSKLLNTKS